MNRLKSVVVVSWFLVSAASVSAATFDVNLSGTTFTPDTLTITTGDTVHWVWDFGIHNVESGVAGVHDGNFRSGDPVPNPHTFDVVFDQTFLDANQMAGNVYPYYCVPHLGFGMIATITVEAPVPAASEWGLLVMVLLLLAMGSVVFYKRREKLILGES